MNNFAPHPILYGCMLTLGIIMPLGAQNIFIFSQGLRQPKFVDSWPAIIATTLCDALIIIAAMLGITFVLVNSVWLKKLILFIGGCYLLWMCQGILQNGLVLTSNHQLLSRSKQILHAISVSMLNPHALLDSCVIIGSNALLFQSFAYKIYFITSCISTELLWFFLLAFAGNRLRTVPNNINLITFVNKSAAVILFIIACSLFTNLFFYH